MNLSTFKTKTGLVGLATVLLGLANVIFLDETTTRTFGQMATELLSGKGGVEVLAGLVAIFGREALSKVILSASKKDH